MYGEKFTKLVVGISVGHEDLDHNSETGRMNGGFGGIEPDILASYIWQTRDTISKTMLANTPVGHVDRWTAWVNGSNQAVIDSSDFLGMNFNLYSQRNLSNTIDKGKSLFDSALAQVKAVAPNMPVWVTEVGFPVSGKAFNQAVPSTENAKKFWKDVGCSLFGTTNV